MQAQKRRVHNQLGGVHHHQLQKYAFRVSDSLKIETWSQRDTTSALLSAARLFQNPTQRRDGMTSHTYFFVKKWTESGMAINSGSRERAMRGDDFKEVARILKVIGFSLLTI